MTGLEDVDDWPRVSRTERLILSILANGEQYGLALVEASEGHLKRGTVYVTLGRMEEKGLVTSRPAGSGSTRRFYKATPLGKRIFHAVNVMQRLLAPRGAR